MRSLVLEEFSVVLHQGSELVAMGGRHVARRLEAVDDIGADVELV